MHEDHEDTGPAETPAEEAPKRRSRRKAAAKAPPEAPPEAPRDGHEPLAVAPDLDELVTELYQHGEALARDAKQPAPFPVSARALDKYGRVLVFDLETLPTPVALALFEPPRAVLTADDVPSSYSKARREEWIANAAGKLAAETRDAFRSHAKAASLSPALGMVAGYGAVIAEGGEVVETRARTLGDDDVQGLSYLVDDDDAHGVAEAELLAELATLIGTADLVVTFNGHGFDVPFLVTRALVRGLELPFDVPSMLQRYRYRPHFDVAAALSNWAPRGGGSLETWLTTFGYPGKTGAGSDVLPLALVDAWPAIGAYALHDTLRTLALATRVVPAFAVAAPSSPARR